MDLISQRSYYKVRSSDRSASFQLHPLQHFFLSIFIISPTPHRHSTKLYPDLIQTSPCVFSYAYALGNTRIIILVYTLKYNTQTLSTRLKIWQCRRRKTPKQNNIPRTQTPRLAAHGQNNRQTTCPHLPPAPTVMLYLKAPKISRWTSLWQRHTET